ncbi:MAG TPA: cytochrome b/b6 domain-containing protein [Gaiellales bacterium]|nr:cytochrome b/b6 domain-containing protein [Gaiellales bacterium]
MALIRRFSKTERAAHWLVAAAFGIMLLSGGMVPHHWSVTTLWFDIHVGAAIVLVGGLVMLFVAADGTALRATVAQLRRMDVDDRAWLSPTRLITRQAPPPVGRFNAGQKVNARLALLGMVALYATGIYLITIGNTAFGTLHGPAAFLTSILIAGHIFMAVVNPATRHALRGMTLGSVEREWAQHHFPRWVEEHDDE